MKTGFRSARRGVTMVEIMIAIGIIGVGVLTLASGATLVTRLTGGGAMQGRAAIVASSHIEQLRATSCTTVSSGQDTVRSVVSRWTVSPITVAGKRRGASVTLTVQYPTVRGLRSQSYRTVLTC